MNYPPQGQYQGGSYMPPPNPYGGPAQVRSGIPKVMGILMIVLASLGLLGTLVGLSGFGNNEALRGYADYDTYLTYQKIANVFGLGLGVLHLLAGIRSVGYKANAPKLAIIYAVLAIVNTVVGLIVMYAWMMPNMPEQIRGAMSVGFVIGGMIGLSYPTVVWALMSRPAAKAACVN
jgi:hypothetical protein